MKLDSLPIHGSEPTTSEFSEYELYEHYDGFLGKLHWFRRLYVRTEELPDILVEAAAFRLGCNDHETGEFGWCPWEVDDPSVFPQMCRFVEKTGQHELAAEIHAFERKLSEFDFEDVSLYFAGGFKSLAKETCDEINDAIAHGFDLSKFDSDIWLQTAHAGAELVRSARIFRSCPDFASLRTAEREIVDMLPDYENRIQEKTMWRVDMPFHALLVSVGERYYHDESLKITRRDGSLLLGRDAHKYDNLSAFNDASRAYLLTSTKREWLCCKLGSTAWLIDPTSSEKVVSAQVTAEKSG